MTDLDFKESLKKLKTPKKIQAFLNKLKDNKRDTISSPKKSIEAGKAHCLEGALIAHAALMLNNKESFLMDIKSKRNDLDHVVLLFKEFGLWGAISKTSYPVLRFRDPVFKTPRELAMSYFPEYFLEDGQKTMLSFSEPFSLKDAGDDWIFTEKDLYEIAWELDNVKHFPVAPARSLKKVRKADNEEVDRVFGKLKL